MLMPVRCVDAALVGVFVSYSLEYTIRTLWQHVDSNRIQLGRCTWLLMLMNPMLSDRTSDAATKQVWYKDEPNECQCRPRMQPYNLGFNS